MIGKALRWCANCFRQDLVKIEPDDLEKRWVEISRKVKPFTLTSPLRIAALANAIEYIEKAKIPGAIVECGVWRGGSMMAAALTLLNQSSTSRDLMLFDTFAGMSEPSESDVSVFNEDARATWVNARASDGNGSNWCFCSLEECRVNLLSVGYPEHRIKFIKGRLEDTLPAHRPDKISLLRLDTDWYDSTLHGLKTLFPQIAPGGVLIIDDYGYWRGAKQAVDEYFRTTGISILLNRIDETGRIALKI